MTASGATAREREQEREEFRARVRAVAPEALEDFRHAVRWWSLSRDREGMPDRERKANRRALRVLTDASRMFPGLLSLESCGPRRDEPSSLEPAPWAPLFRLLYAGCEGRVELRALPSRARTFLAPTDNAGIARFVAQHADQDLYMGIATRRNDQGGDLEHCHRLAVLFCDLDFKTIAEPDARERLAKFTPAPSAIVASGGGWHCYWRLATPLALPEQAHHAKQLLRQLARAVGADLSAAEPARILRLPGTANHKYQPARAVFLEAP